MAIHSASGFRQSFLARLKRDRRERTQIMDLSLVRDGLQRSFTMDALSWADCSGCNVEDIVDVLSWTVCYGYFLLDAVS